MSLTDYVISVLLVGLVIRQLHGRQLTAFGLMWPVGLVGIAIIEYLHAIPTQGNDVALLLVTTIIGATLGVLCGLFTSVIRADNGNIIGRATGIAAILWVIGIGSRIAFGLYASNGGGETIANVSAKLDITSAEAWITALLFMSLAEVLGRTAILGTRSWRLKTTH